MFFLYTKTNGKVFPSKQSELRTDGHNKVKNENVVFKKQLTDKEKNMTLDELMVTYPYQS